MREKKKNRAVAEGKEQGYHDIGGRLPLYNVREEVGQVTTGVFLSRKMVEVKRGNKKEQSMVVRAIIDGEEQEFFANGLLGWLFAEEQGVVENDQFKLTYKGLENPEKKPGIKNRHQFRLQIKDK